MKLSNTIKKLAIDKGVKMKDLATALDKSTSGFSHTLKLDDYRVSELEKIATTLGCKLVIDFVEE